MNPAQTINFQQKTFVAQALDPIHIGTGEFRLGRVDNTIVREPGTNLPKIPGSSIAGVVRAYAAMKKNVYLRENGKSCAGKGGGDGTDHCGVCEVCTAFGYSHPTGSFQGLAQFSDARILFFPVYSLLGPRWISCPSSLESAGCTPPAGGAWQWWNKQLEQKALVLGEKTTLPQINLGWMYLPVLVPTVPLPNTWASAQGNLYSPLGPMFERLVLVNDGVFSQIVDDQLEVRTSVSISPATGAAEPGALFTAEALPRATALFFQVTALNPRYFRRPDKTSLETDLPAIHSTVRVGLDLIEFLGIGGSNTRGMGRMKVYPEVNSHNG